MNRFWAMALGIFALTVPLMAQPSVAIRSDIQPREVYIGDPIFFHLLVTVSSDVAQVPFALPNPLENFELVAASSPTVTIDKDGKSNTAYQFILMTFSTGSLTFPSLPLKFSTPGGAQSEGKTEPVTIRVKSLLEEKGDEGNLRPLKGLFNFKSYFWLWMTLLLFAVVLGGYFLWVWLTGRKLGLILVPAAPPRPPEELAWEAIHALEDDDLVAQGQSKEFYFRLSIILREYLERRHGISALDRTTSELLAEFRRQNFPLMEVNLLRSFLDSADLVKFAKFTPTEEEVANDLNQVKQVINLSTPKKTAAVEEKVSL